MWLLTVLALILIITGLVLVYRRGRNYSWSNVQIAHGAVCIALSGLLSTVKLFHLPLGGSVTAASYLPILLFSYVYGTAPGMLLGALFSLFRFVTGSGNAIAYGILPFLLDYPAGYAMLGVCGLFRHKPGGRTGLLLGIIAACALKAVMSVVSGAVFFVDSIPADFASPWVFSLLYNGSYMLPEAAICIAVALTAGERLLRRLSTAELNCHC